MKILFLTSWFPSRLNPTLGNFVERHLRAVESVGCEVMVIHEAGNRKFIAPKLESETIEGTTIHHLLVPGYLRSFKSPAYQKLKQYITEFNPDIIHGHVIYPVGSLAQKIAADFSLPLVFTEHWSGFKEVNKAQYTDRVNRIVQETMKYCSFLLPVSEDLGRSIAQKGIVTPQRVVYNAVDTSLFNLNLKAKDDGEFIFLHISNFDKRSKNTEGIIEAFSKLNRKAKLVIAGDGDLNRIRHYAEKLDADFTRLEFHGSLKYSEVANIMKKSDCHVLFSNFENLPCVIAEALCCGLPNIATAVGGVPEMIDDTNGLMIQPADIEALTSAMQQMMNDSIDYNREEISANASQKYGYHQIGREYLEVYNKVLTP